MIKAVLRNRMDIITACKDAPVPLSKQNMFITDESANVSSLLNHVRAQVNALSDRTPSLWDLKSVVWIMGLWAEKLVNYFGNHYLDASLLWHTPILLLQYLPPLYPAAPK